MSPRDFAAIILHDGDGRVFLQQRAKNKAFLPGYWSFFGGEIREGERPIETVRREARRELHFASRRPKFVISSKFQHEDFPVRLNLFTEKCDDPSQIQLKEGYFGAWVSKDELSSLPVLEHDRHLISYTERWLEAQKERYVSAILLYDDDGRFLLQKREEDRKFLPGYWATFGGGIDAHEDALTAVRREAKEELGVDLINPELVIESTYHHDALRVYMYIFAERIKEKSTLKLLEGQDWGWFHAEEIEDLKMLEHDKDVIRYVDEWLKAKNS